jgi:hypothetical protein
VQRQGGDDVDIHLVYQRVANAADAPLSVAPQDGGVNPDKQSGGIEQRQQPDIT